jgi:hypothetical protein
MSHMHRRDRSLSIVAFALVALALTALSACDGMGRARAGASDRGAHGRIKMGVPF